MSTIQLVYADGRDQSALPDEAVFPLTLGGIECVVKVQAAGFMHCRRVSVCQRGGELIGECVFLPEGKISTLGCDIPLRDMRETLAQAIRESQVAAW